MYKKITFENGLRLVTIPMAGVRSITTLVLVAAGSRYETKETNGIAHFTEHMLFKGTTKRPTPFDISAIIDGIGGEYNAFTGKEHTGAYIKASSAHLNLTLDVLSDVYINPILSEGEIEKERSVIIGEINLYEDMPMRKIGQLFEKLLYGDTPLGRPISGEKYNIHNVKRPDFLYYMDSLYSPSNMIIGVAGNIENIDVAEIVEQHFGALKKKKIPSYQVIKEVQKKPSSAIHYKKTEQTHLAIGFRAYKINHPDRYGIEVLNAILGSGSSSRLFTSIREKRGLAYYIQSMVEKFSDSGYIMAVGGIDIQKTEEAIKIILEEFKKLTTDKVSELELKKAKEYLKGKLVLELEDTESVADIHAVQELMENKIYTPEEILVSIDKVTSSNVQRIAKDIFKASKLNMIVLGPFKEDKFSKLLNNF